MKSSLLYSLYGLMLMLFISSCNNDLKYLGVYKLHFYKRKVANQQPKEINAYLILEKRHYFKIRMIDQLFEGEWKYYDSGDNSLIDFNLKGESRNNNFQSLVGTDDSNKIIIKIINPHIFFRDSLLEEVEFAK